MTVEIAVTEHFLAIAASICGNHPFYTVKAGFLPARGGGWRWGKRRPCECKIGVKSL